MYTTSEAALVVLEVWLHLNLTPDLLRDDYVLLTINFDDLEGEFMAGLPSDPARSGDR